MKVGVPTEIKPDEYRVAITPIGVRELTEHGHAVLIQSAAGEGSAISDSARAGAHQGPVRLRCDLRRLRDRRGP
jgi:alanine dehydrogenase